MDKIVQTFEEGETLETLVQDGGSIYIEATVNGIYGLTRYVFINSVVLNCNLSSAIFVGI